MISRDFGCGELLTLAGDGCAALHRFIRDGHRDTRTIEHVYPSHSLVFTSVGEWSYHGAERKQLVDGRSLVAGTGLQHYACSHPRGMPNECFVVSLRNDAFESSDDLFRRPIVRITADVSAHERAMVEAAQEPGRLEALAFSLFDVVSRASNGTRDVDRIDVRMAYAKRVMAEMAGLSVTVADIARELHLSRYTFTRRFLAHAKTTPHAYLTSLRIARAKEQLRSTAMPVEEIALANGFCSISHFSHAFRRLVTTTPTAFRRLRSR
jgi:AraC-like DNA-binding protein